MNFSSNKTSIFDSYLTLLPCACVILTASRLVLLTHVTFWLQLYQAIGSIDATAKTSKEDILANTDLSADKTDILCRFFQDPEFYLSPKFNWWLQKQLWDHKSWLKLKLHSVLELNHIFLGRNSFRTYHSRTSYFSATITIHATWATTGYVKWFTSSPR